MTPQLPGFKQLLEQLLTLEQLLLEQLAEPFEEQLLDKLIDLLFE